jgi:hypothetical protein
MTAAQYLFLSAGLLTFVISAILCPIRYAKILCTSGGSFIPSRMRSDCG